MSDGMRRELAYLSSHATNRYFIPNWGTYCAKGAVRRLLQSVGFTVERLPGPPGGKREILRATK